MKRSDKEDRVRSHTALMDGVYRYQRHVYDATRKYFLFGRDRLIRDLHLHPQETLVEIGCGTARNLIRIARTYPGAHLYGLDASLEMLRSAQESVRRARLQHRIFLIHGLAEEMTPDLFGLQEKFDRAVFSYSLSMIPDWRGALRMAAHAVRSDGSIHIVDFGDFEGLWGPVARGLRRWLGFYHVQPRESLLKTFELRVGRPDVRPHVLPARYAFVLKCSPTDIAMPPFLPSTDPR